MNDVEVTRPMVGLCGMQACVKKGLSDKEILKQVNQLNPCGTIRGWCGIEREGNSAPVQCEDYKDREHLIIVC